MNLSSAHTESVGPEVSLKQDHSVEVREFLESGAAWPGESLPECIETHASLVFLTRDRAWKLKKPVRLVHVDQVTLKSRAYLCREELRLNRALSGDIYRGLTPIVRQPDGSLSLGGKGCIIDWLIEIVRLPTDQMLDARIVNGPAPEPDEIEAVFDVLVNFYRRQPEPSDAGKLFHARLLNDINIAATHLCEMQSETKLMVPDPTIDFARQAIDACRDEIIERGANGLIVEGHGDLRAEHICLVKPPVLFDRLEIDHGIRLIDPFYEINGLGLECALMDAEWVRAVLLVKLSQAMRPPTRDLLTAYGVVVFLTRARIAADHFRDDNVATPEKWRVKCKLSLAAAEKLIAQAGRL